MNTTRLAMLRHIAAKPRTMDEMCSFKLGPWAQLSETTVHLYVYAMVTSGHLQRQNGAYTATERGQRLLAGEQEPTAGRICNASSRDTYTGQQWVSARPGADDHRKFKSRGV